MLSLSIVVLAGNLATEPNGIKENELLFPILFSFSVPFSQNTTKSYEVFNYVFLSQVSCQIGKEKPN